MPNDSERRAANESEAAVMIEVELDRLLGESKSWRTPVTAAVMSEVGDSETGPGRTPAVSTHVDIQTSEVEEISLQEGRVMLDEAARQYLNMSGDEFITAWDEGRFTEPDTLRVQQVAGLLPFGR